MKTKHLNPEVLVELAERLPVAASAREHLGLCGECSARVKGFEATLSALCDVDVPEPESAYWADFSSRLERRIQGESKRRPLRFLVWAAAAAVLCGLVLAREVFVGGGEAPSEALVLLPPLEQDAEFQFLVSVADFAEPGEDWESLAPGAFSLVDLPSLTAQEEGLLVERLKKSVEPKSDAKS